MTNHAKENALSWAQEIERLMQAHDAAESCDDIDAANQEIDESPLSVRVRDDWRAIGDCASGAAEYEILLTTGGPALRIIGAVSEYGDALDARLQYQDWGTPWTDYHELTEAQEQALLDYARRFVFAY